MTAIFSRTTSLYVYAAQRDEASRDDERTSELPGRVTR